MRSADYKTAGRVEKNLVCLIYQSAGMISSNTYFDILMNLLLGYFRIMR